MEAVKPPVMMLEVLDTHGRCQTHLRLSGAGSHCKVGRDLSCDLVIDDAYAAPEHTQLTLQEDGRVLVTDLGSRNGTRIGERKLDNASVTLEDGRVLIGRTLIRVRTLHSPLSPEKIFRRDMLQRHRTLLAFAGLTWLISFVVFNEWREATEEVERNIFLGVAVVFAILVVWVSLWALVTRVSHGAWSLRVHLAVITNAAALIAWGVWFFGVAVFATGWTWLEWPISVAALGLLLGALYLHLRKATHLSQRLAAIIAITVPLVLGGTAAWVGWQGEQRNVNRQEFGIPVYPPALRVASSTDLDEFVVSLTELKRETGRLRQQSLAEKPMATVGPPFKR